MSTTTATFSGYISNGTSGTPGTILTVTSVASGTISLGMWIYTSPIASNVISANTHILGFGTGTGGVGTYIVSISQAKGSIGTPLTNVTGTSAATVLAADYNYIQAITSNVLGVGSGTYGYGLSSTPYINATSTATVGSSVPASLWVALRQDLINAYTHQGSIGGLTIPAIPAKAAANAGGTISATDFANYLALANSINTNPLTLGAGQSSLINITTGSQGVFTGTQWKTLVTHSLTLTWSTNAQLRGYFNAGGNLQFSASLTGYNSSTDGTSYAKELDWSTLLSSIGTITMNYNSLTCSGTYTSIVSTAGVSNLTSTSTNIFNKTVSSSTDAVYYPNQYDIYANLNGTYATATSITFSIQFQDNATTSGHGTYGVDEYVSVTCTLTSKVQSVWPSGTYVQVTIPTQTTNTITGS